MQADALLNAYIDLNLLVIAGACLWFAARAALSRSAAALAYQPQLRLLNSMTVFLAAAPFVALGINMLGLGRAPTLSDVLVAQYLQGNVSMSAAEFEGLIGLREDLVRDLTTQASVWSRGITALITLGALASLGHFLLAVVQLRRTLRRAFHWRQIGRVQLLISDEVPVAFSTRGLFRLYVVLPAQLLQSPRDLRLTLAHELQHFRQRDVETAVLLELLRPVLFWNPAFYLWRRDMRSIREFACDQALRCRGRFDARAYCECLIRATSAARASKVTLSERGPVAALLDRREIRRMPVLARRIIAVTEADNGVGRGPVWALVSGLFVLVVLSIALLIQRPADWSHDRIMLSTIVNLERMAARSSAPTAVTALSGGFMVSSQ